MEPMEFDFDVDREFQSRMESCGSHDPTGTDMSDMEVDTSSPTVQRSENSPPTSSLVSSFLDTIGLSLSTKVSLRTLEAETDTDSSLGVFSSDQIVTQLTPSHDHWKPSLTPVQGAVKFRKGLKPGYGIPEGETMFSHFPKTRMMSGSGRVQTGSAEVRKRASKRPGEAESEAREREKILNTEPASVTSGENASFSREMPCDKSGFPTCARTACLVVVATVVALCAVVYFLDENRRQCKLSREFDERRLRVDLENYLFGQHIATKIVPEKFRELFDKFRYEHFQETTVTETFSRPSSEKVGMCKPLVLSFSGSTGVGKNFVSRIISEFLPYAKTHYIVTPFLFPHRTLEEDYGLQVKSWIIGKSTSCVVNVFVVDEVDKAFPAVVNGISEAVSALTSPCDTGSPTVFLLLSNLHAVEIAQKFVSHVIKDHRPRDSLTAADFQEILTVPSPGMAGVSNTVDLSTEKWIDFFVPFLPLEKRHVVECVRRDLVSKGLSTEPQIVEMVVGELRFIRHGSLELSVTGCKRVADKVDYVTVERDLP